MRAAVAQLTQLIAVCSIAAVAAAPPAATAHPDAAGLIPYRGR